MSKKKSEKDIIDKVFYSLSKIMFDFEKGNETDVHTIENVVYTKIFMVSNINAAKNVIDKLYDSCLKFYEKRNLNEREIKKYGESVYEILNIFYFYVFDRVKSELSLRNEKYILQDLKDIFSRLRDKLTDHGYDNWETNRKKYNQKKFKNNIKTYYKLKVLVYPLITFAEFFSIYFENHILTFLLNEVHFYRVHLYEFDSMTKLRKYKKSMMNLCDYLNNNLKKYETETTEVFNAVYAYDIKRRNKNLKSYKKEIMKFKKISTRIKRVRI